jgi:general secretion pathway protein J
MICNGRACRDEHGSENGFSLLEVLISLTLFSMVLLLLPGAFRTGKRGWETSARIEQSAATKAAGDFLRHRLAEAVPLYDRDESGRVRLAFYGGPQDLSFVAAAPSGPSGGGLYRFKLVTAPGRQTGSSALVLRLSAYRPQSFEGEQALPEHILVPMISSLGFKYFGEQIPGEAATWADKWERSDRLPSLVEIEAGSNGRRLESLGPLRIELRLQSETGRNR